jgi:hypothetical protein
MLDLTKSTRNLLEIRHAASGTVVGLFYRTPTTQERVGYSKGHTKRVGNKMVDSSFENRLKYARKICTGIREGDFGYEGRPVSSDPESADYREDWKALLEEMAADLLTVLAIIIFEGTFRNVDIEGDEEESPEDGEGEDVPPLPRSSDGG